MQDDTRETLVKYDLPELPETIDACDTDQSTVELVVYRFKQEKLALAYVSEEDAQEYCSRDDTRGDDENGPWFVGYRRL